MQSLSLAGAVGKERKDCPKLFAISDPRRDKRHETFTQVCLQSNYDVLPSFVPPLLNSSVNLNQQRCNEPQSEAYSNDFHRAGKTDQSLHGGGGLWGKRWPIAMEESKNRKLLRIWLAISPFVEFSLFNHRQERLMFLLESWNMGGVRFPPGMWLCVAVRWSQRLKNQEFVWVCAP